MNYNKESIEKSIKRLERAVEMEAYIRATVDKMKHYKQVNKKFVDAIKEDPRFHAYINKDQHSTVLMIYEYPEYNTGEVFRVFISHWNMDSVEQILTWEKIENEFKRYNYAGRLEEMRKRLNVFEVERESLREVMQFMDKLSFHCFDLYKVKSELKDMLSFADKNTVGSGDCK